MPIEFEITGTESVEAILKGLPQKYAKKPMVATFRKGARKFTTVLRKNTPKDSGETRKGIKVKTQRGIGITAGFQGGAYLPAYFKAYWSNYGTLARRDKTHAFVRPRKSQSVNWSGGIRKQNFVEDSWNQTKTQVQQTINSELKEQTLKFLNKHKVN